MYIKIQASKTRGEDGNRRPTDPELQPNKMKCENIKTVRNSCIKNKILKILGGVEGGVLRDRGEPPIRRMTRPRRLSRTATHVDSLSADLCRERSSRRPERRLPAPPDAKHQGAKGSSAERQQPACWRKSLLKPQARCTAAAQGLHCRFWLLLALLSPTI